MDEDVQRVVNARMGIHETLDIEVVEASPERVVVTLQVGPAVHQPYGIMHGGVSALLAESAASIGGGVTVGPTKAVVGIELNASHVRSISEGTLTAVATPVRAGRTIHVWAIDLHDEEGRQVCIARCTLAVIDRAQRA